MNLVKPITTVALACAALAVIPASSSAMIQVQRGIAGVPLNATQAQVRTALGTPTVRHGSNDFGAYTEFRYPGKITVTFQGNSRVTAVSTRGLGDRTAAGVGVGSTESAVRQKVSGAHCATESGFRHCQVGQSLPGRRVTDFAIRGGRVSSVVVGFVID